MNTFTKVSLSEHCALHEQDAPRAIPTMYILGIKKDENHMPLRDKSLIVILVNHNECTWSKSQCYTLVFQSDSLHYLISMDINQHRVIKQGDTRNTVMGTSPQKRW